MTRPSEASINSVWHRPRTCTREGHSPRVPRSKNGGLLGYYCTMERRLRVYTGNPRGRSGGLRGRRAPASRFCSFSALRWTGQGRWHGRRIKQTVGVVLLGRERRYIPTSAVLVYFDCYENCVRPGWTRILATPRSVVAHNSSQDSFTFVVVLSKASAGFNCCRDRSTAIQLATVAC